MNIISQDTPKKRKVIVQNLEKDFNIKQLLSLLQTALPIEISFLNIQMLPKEVVLALAKRKKNIEIFINESSLKTYLMNLGFKLTFESNYKDKKLKTLNLQYLALAGSAGSLSRVSRIIETLPASHLSVFVIMHQKADKESYLCSLLQNHTSHYKVVEAKSDMKIESATVYVAPAGKHLIVAGNFIFLTDEPKRNFSRPSISTSFESLSQEFKNTLLCVLLSGYGNDGSDALKTLQQNATTIVIEDPQECEAKPMLQNAIETKRHDYVLKLDEICEYIYFNLQAEVFSHEQLHNFLQKVHKKYGYDYCGYNMKHISRRINLFYSTLKPKSFAEFEKMVLNDKSIFKDLFLNISVNITTFFRNPEVFKSLREDILPKLDSFMDLKVWCAGCSSGEEPYSVAIFLKELGLLDRSLIYATDLNEVVLQNAQNGLYSKQSYNTFLKHYYQAGGNESFSQYFTDHGDFVEVNETLKEKILFFRHNLALDAKINDFQLIFCRNVLIYFDKELKQRIFELFKSSLDSYGFLVLGESESLECHSKYITIDNKNKIYKRKK
jgi:chemotaxis protein methyltransferase CheR